MTYGIYCTRCGFFPSDGGCIGVTSRPEQAENAASIHEDDAHHVFVVPQEWIDRSSGRTKFCRHYRTSESCSCRSPDRPETTVVA